ncbi:unnamed protein product [Musa acuminata subsp. malaccensis]|uniref:(wild Malaysian banana) hypothetical protein n=1 Tax=Musa acuminata subsp. malaccensis TaxID=214687 RepID=A0A8D7EWQ5_MUSAM|nr:unnamed protein product [Musa acuminata subsp. malaccensis]
MTSPPGTTRECASSPVSSASLAVLRSSELFRSHLFLQERGICKAVSGSAFLRLRVRSAI